MFNIAPSSRLEHTEACSARSGEWTGMMPSERRCGTCTLCCKVLTIPEFGNPSGQWCPHCVQGRGCTIYPNWPNECRAFQCGYLMWPELGEHWRPSRSKLVVAFKPDGMEIVFHVDPGVPNAWRAEPYYSEIRSMADRRREGRPTQYLCRSGERSSWSSRTGRWISASWRRMRGLPSRKRREPEGSAR